MAGNSTNLGRDLTRGDYEDLEKWVSFVVDAFPGLERDFIKSIAVHYTDANHAFEEVLKFYSSDDYASSSRRKGHRGLLEHEDLDTQHMATKLLDMFPDFRVQDVVRVVRGCGNIDQAAEILLNQQYSAKEEEVEELPSIKREESSDVNLYDTDSDSEYLTSPTRQSTSLSHSQNSPSTLQNSSKSAEERDVAETEILGLDHNLGGAYFNDHSDIDHYDSGDTLDEGITGDNGEEDDEQDEDENSESLDASVHEDSADDEESLSSVRNNPAQATNQEFIDLVSDDDDVDESIQSSREKIMDEVREREECADIRGGQASAQYVSRKRNNEDLGSLLAASNKRHCNNDLSLDGPCSLASKWVKNYAINGTIDIEFDSYLHPVKIPKEFFAGFSLLPSEVDELDEIYPGTTLKFPGVSRAIFDLAVRYSVCQNLLLSACSITQEIDTIMALVKFAKDVGLKLNFEDQAPETSIMGRLRKNLTEEREALRGSHIRIAYTLPKCHALRKLLVKAAVSLFYAFRIDPSTDTLDNDSEDEKSSPDDTHHKTTAHKATFGKKYLPFEKELDGKTVVPDFRDEFWRLFRRSFPGREMPAAPKIRRDRPRGAINFSKVTSVTDPLTEDQIAI